MFSSADRIRKRTPKKGIDRKEYITLLVDEYYETTNLEAQEQVTANLANFSYDPINYPFLKSAKALELFLELLSSTNLRLILHGIAGICNICIDNEFKENIIRLNGITLIINLLTTIDDTDIIINTITTLIYLLTDETKAAICSKENIQRIRILSEESCTIPRRLRTLANLFLEDYCTIITTTTIKTATSSQSITDTK